MRSLNASDVMISSPVSSPMNSEKPGKPVPFAAASFSNAAAHCSRSTNSLSGSCLHSTRLPMSTQPIPPLPPEPPAPPPAPPGTPGPLPFPGCGPLDEPDADVGSEPGFGDDDAFKRSLFTDALVSAFTVTFVERNRGQPCAGDAPSGDRKGQGGRPKERPPENESPDPYAQ
ncbi:hypothetical protein ALC56_14041 [Trachymyrmex septentrionalis]|uniref:Uncharacterized protein n=1 Tax=Trachymyrmex septentrionalis TaxID=34720 RepID=A0A151JTT0_9HYME|nr:hypothetical protein ALC56_14041 [Trachymyrmex septentrionalis]